MPSGVFKDLTGMRFGRLVVLQKVPNIKSKVVYKCLCDCGKEVIVRADSIAWKKKNNTKSCGCLQKEAARMNGKKSRKPLGVKLIGDLISNYKRRAKIKGLSWDLTRIEFEFLIKQPCWYCGCLPGNVARHQRIKDEILFYNGIDRINSDSGYLMDNCVSSCIKCNQAKLDYPVLDFYIWVDKLHKNLTYKGIL